MDNKSVLLETNEVEAIRDALIRCHHKNIIDPIQQVNMYIYDLTKGTDLYVIEYNDSFNLLIGIINPLKERNSIKIKTLSLNDLKGHQLMYKYLEDCSLLETLSNLESNEYFLLKENKL